MNGKLFPFVLTVTVVATLTVARKIRTVAALADSQPKHTFCTKSCQKSGLNITKSPIEMTISSEGMNDFHMREGFSSLVLALSIVFHSSLHFFQRVVSARFLSKFPASSTLLSLQTTQL